MREVDSPGPHPRHRPRQAREQPSDDLPVGKIALTLLVVFLIAIVVIQGCVGIYQVEPGEAAALQTFGAAKPEPVTDEGLHWHWPSPIGETTVVQVRKNRTAEIGFNTLPDGKINSDTGENWQRDLTAATMITGDLNLLEVQLVVQYQITDLNAYLFEADDPGVSFTYTAGKTDTYDSHPQGRPDGQTLKDTAEVALRRSVGQRTIDQVMVLEREAIERETMEYAQELLDVARTGITITSVQIQEIKPPDEVQEAFDDVLKAREEKDTRINEALAFESRTLPEARGQAERIRKDATAYRAQRVNEAQGEADRFLAILEEYQSSPAIIAKRMYLETMDQVLPRTNQVLVAGADVGPLIINMDGRAQSNVVPVETENQERPAAEPEALPVEPAN